MAKGHFGLLHHCSPTRRHAPLGPLAPPGPPSAPPTWAGPNSTRGPAPRASPAPLPRPFLFRPPQTGGPHLSVTPCRHSRRPPWPTYSFPLRSVLLSRADASCSAFRLSCRRHLLHSCHPPAARLPLSATSACSALDCPHARAPNPSIASMQLLDAPSPAHRARSSILDVRARPHPLNPNGAPIRPP